MHDGHPTLLRGGRDSRRAHAAIVGGSLISVVQAPWQVEVSAMIPISPTEALVLRCSGSILNTTEILTAAHCVFDPLSGEKIPADQITVQAGTSDFREPEEGEQEILVSQVRVHPFYDYEAQPEGDPDDVAVLILGKPLELSATAQPIALTASSSLIPEGTAVNLTGFGAQIPEVRANGRLYSLGMSLAFSRRCAGGANALLLCASASTGAVCNGDSGSGLTVPGSPLALVGVVDFNLISGEGPCADGALAGFANVAAPEIGDFISGSESPPQAPRGGGAVIEGILTSGESLSCRPGSWSNSPTFEYAFVNSANGAVLQSGSSSTYQLSSVDVGQSVLCEVHASNAGGVGVGRTPGLGPIHASKQEEEAARKKQEEEAVAAAAAAAANGASQGVVGFHAGIPPLLVPDVQLVSTALEASSLGAVSIKVTCPAGVTTCTGTVTLRTLTALAASRAGAAKAKGSGVLTLATASFTVAGGRVVSVKLHLSRRAQALLARMHVLRARATVLAHDSAGTTHTTQTIVTLRVAKAKHAKR